MVRLNIAACESNGRFHWQVCRTNMLYVLYPDVCVEGLKKYPF